VSKRFSRIEKGFVRFHKNLDKQEMQVRESRSVSTGNVYDLMMLRRSFGFVAKDAKSFAARNPTRTGVDQLYLILSFQRKTNQ